MQSASVCNCLYKFYIEKKLQYYSWILVAMHFEITIQSEYFTSDNIWFLCTTHIMLSCTAEKYRAYMISISQLKYPPQKLRDKNMSQKDQYEERYKHLKVSHLDRNDRDM